MNKPFLEEVERYLDKANMAQSTFGKLADNNPGLVGNLRKGMDPSPVKQNKLRKFMHDFPNGPPGHLRRAGKAVAPKQHASASTTFTPGRLVSATSEFANSGAHLARSTTAAQDVPAPSLSALPQTLGEIIKAEAFKQRMPISTFLAQLVSMGWEVYKDV